MGRKKKEIEKPATPEQIKIIETALGQPIDEFMQIFSNDAKRKMFADNLIRKTRQTEWLTSLASGNGTYQPIYSEQLLQQANINPVAASSTQIDQWLLSPQYYDQNLRHLSQYLSYAVGQYNRAVTYMNTIKSYKYKLLPSNYEDSDSYMNAYSTSLKTLQKLNIRYQIPKVDLQTMIDGTSFYWLTETSDTISLLPLPADYCYITAPWTYGYLFAIDLVFFDQFISVPQQIPELYEAYTKFTALRKAMFQGEDLAPFQYYQVPPEHGWVFTFNPSMPDKLPPLTSAMGAALDTLSYKELLKNKIALDLFKIIALKIPMDKENRQMSMTYKVASEIVEVIQSLLPNNIKVYSSPFDSEPISTDQANRFEEIVNISNDTFYASSGFSATMFGSSSIKTGAALKISSTVDFNYASYHTYRQYENFINFQLKLRSPKYNFQVQMFGNALNEESEREMALKEMTLGNSGVLDYFATKGYEPFQVTSTLLLEEKLKLRDKMPPIISAFNNKIENTGRPTNTNVGDAGEVTRDYDTNKKFSISNCLCCDKKLESTIIDKVFCSNLCKDEYCEENKVE